MSRNSVREPDTLTSQFFIKTDTAPTTAFSGGHKSDDSLTVSIAILTAAYAVCQPVSLPGTASPSLGVSRTLENGLPIERAMAVDETASALEFLREMRSCTRFVGDVHGVETGMSSSRFDLRKRGITVVDDNKLDDRLPYLQCKAPGTPKLIIAPNLLDFSTCVQVR